MPVELTANTLFHSSSVVSRKSTGDAMPAMFSTAPTIGHVGRGDRVAGSQHRRLVGHVDAAAVGRDAVLLGQFGGQLLGGGRVEVEAGDGPAVGGEPAGGGAADAALGADPGDYDGALSGAHDG